MYGLHSYLPLRLLGLCHLAASSALLSVPTTKSHLPTGNLPPPVGTPRAISPSACSIIVNPTATSTACGNDPLPSGYVNVTIPAFLTTNDTGDCANGRSINPSCWRTLSLADYVSWWWGAFQNQCPNNTGFGDCFYTLSTGTASSCTQTNQEHCTQPQSNNFSSSWQGVRDFYVRNTIYNINGFFTNYWSAVGAAYSIALGSIGQITQIIDPPQESTSFLNDLFSALAIGLAFVDAPEAAPAFVGVLITAAQQTPALATLLFPDSDEYFASELLQWADVSDGLSKITKQLQANIADSIGVALSTNQNFVSMANSTLFSNLTVPDTEDLENRILPQLYAYVISQLLATNNFVLTRTLDTDVNALQTNGTALNWNTGCNGYGPKFNSCGSFWYDWEVGHTYALMQADKTLTNTTDLQASLYEYEGPELLLRGAQHCSDIHGSGAQRYHPGINVTQGLTDGFVCMSSLITCTWSMTAELRHYSDDCTVGYNLDPRGEVITNFDVDQVNGADIVPLQYLGWGILDNAAYKSTDLPLESESVYLGV